MEESFYKQHTEPQLTTGNQEIPDYIGPYKIESTVSKGGMGWVYLGIEPQTNKTLAIKTLPSQYLNDELITEQFRQEAKLASLSDHPNIVKLYAEGLWDQGLYIAMEWVQGISLRQFLSQHSFTLKRSLEILTQVAFALEHLHSNQVIHRDLKPENILIEENGGIKVIDFGISQLINRPIDEKSAPFMGTPHYMSPEQKSDPTHVTFASDIYSLGVIAYELIAGKARLDSIELSMLPKGLGKIIEKTLAISPSQRYQNASDLIHDLSIYRDSEEFNSEKPGHEYARELLELFQTASISLSPLPAPSWEFVETGIARRSSENHLGLYYDFFKVTPDTFLCILASPVKQGLYPLFASATLRGMIRSYMAQVLRNNPETFEPLSLIRFLSQHISDPFIKDFSLCYLFLDAKLDQLTFFGAGYSSLIHIPDGSEPRVLRNEHPLLFEDALGSFSQTQDNWNLSDTLILHSLITDKDLQPERRTQMETELTYLTKDSTLLSAQPQAEALLEKTKHQSMFKDLKDTQVVISLQRIL